MLLNQNKLILHKSTLGVAYSIFVCFYFSNLTIRSLISFIAFICNLSMLDISRSSSFILLISSIQVFLTVDCLEPRIYY